MNLPKFSAELKRRHVYKVGVAYVVVAWLLIQAASILFPTFGAPGWTMKVFVLAIALGFPLAIVLAWAFELTPEGIKRAEDVSAQETVRGRSGRKLTMTIALVALIAAGLLIFQFTHKTTAIRQANLGADSKSIAVLPFENLSSDKENAFFAQGIQDEIITTLSRISGLHVISRTSTARYRAGKSSGNRKRVACSQYS